MRENIKILDRIHGTTWLLILISDFSEAMGDIGDPAQNCVFKQEFKKVSFIYLINELSNECLGQIQGRLN